jgi:hypothetical protein
MVGALSLNFSDDIGRTVAYDCSLNSLHLIRPAGPAHCTTAPAAVLSPSLSPVDIGKEHMNGMRGRTRGAIPSPVNLTQLAPNEFTQSFRSST